MRHKLFINKLDFWLIFFETVLLVTCTIFYDDINNLKYVVLPISFVLGQVIISVYCPKWKTTPALLVFMGGFLIKLYVYPLWSIIFGPGEYYSDSTTKKILESIVIQIYEYYSLVLVSILFTNNEMRKSKTLIHNESKYQDQYYNEYYRLIIKIMAIVSILLLILYSPLLNRFRLIYISSAEVNEQWYNRLELIRGVPLLISEFGFWLIEIEKILIVYLLIVFIKYKVNFIKDYSKIILSITFVLSLIIVTTNDRAGSFISAIAMLFLIIRLYPNYEKMFYSFFVVGILLIAVMVIIVLPMRDYSYSSMYGSSSDPTYVSKKVNAYFGGTANVSAALSMPRENATDYIIGDILGYIPMIKYINNYPMSYKLFNSVLGLSETAQITPGIGQSYFYFGFLLSPLLQIIVLLFSLKCQYRANNSNNSYAYFVFQYIAIFSSAGLSLYYFSLDVLLLMQYAFPMYIILLLFSKGVKENEKKGTNLSTSR